ncbi:MAG: dehydrogenase [Bacteroidales bacterium]|nr:dehydrogenase [Bacteroidales bacterium]MCF8333025.1 dehydrogenase [Bacteroidales bacterium]
MVIRSKAPLRLGLAGGGTDVAPYSDIYGGAILNATISMYAYATLLPRNDGKIVLHSVDKHQDYEYLCAEKLPIDGRLDLHKGVYNRVMKDFTIDNLPAFDLYTYVDAPPGSGLGTSSTLTVSILGAFAEWFQLPLGEYDMASLAYNIERVDLQMAGGKQDQYAATFGGVNFMEFKKDNIIVNPLRIRSDYMNELAHNLVLYYTETSRLSSKIIETQSSNVLEKKKESIEAMHKLKEQSLMMKEALLKGHLDEIGRILDFGWQHKKNMASDISNSFIDEIYQTAMDAGATGGKISGAGGGGFMIFYCPLMTRNTVIEALQEKYGGQAKRYDYVVDGLRTWSVNEK